MVLMKKDLKNKFKKASTIALLLVIGILGSIFSCWIPSGLSGTSSLILPDYAELKQGAFRGGSVIYNPDNKLVNHIIEGMSIPVRLAELEVTYDPGKEMEDLSEIDDSVVYGVVSVISVATGFIELEYCLLNDLGSKTIEITIILPAGSKYDMDNDGDYDIAYGKPSDTRQGFEHAMYLTFICSRKHKQTTMYKLSPDHYPDGKYPSGIIGVNPGGKFLVQKEGFASQTRSGPTGIYTSENRCLKAGDFVISKEGNNFEKISTITTSRSGATAVTDDAELTASEVLEYMYLNIEGDMEELIARYCDRDNRTYYDIYSKSYTKYLLNDSSGYIKFQNDFSFGINLSASLKVTVTSVKGSARISLEASNKASLSANFERELPNPSNPFSMLPLIRKIKLTEPKKTFYIYGVPFELKLPIYVGMIGSGYGHASFSTDVTVSAEAGFKASLKARYFPPNADADASPIFNIDIDYTRPSFSVDGEVTLLPYLEVSPAVEIAHAATPECVNTIQLGCYANTYGNATLSLGFSSSANIDVLGIKTLKLGTLINKSWTLYER